MSGVLFLKELYIKQQNVFRYMVFQYFVPERHLSTNITHRSYAVKNVTADKLAEINIYWPVILMAPCIIDFLGANGLLGPVGGRGPWTLLGP